MDIYTWKTSKQGIYYNRNVIWIAKSWLELSYKELKHNSIAQNPLHSAKCSVIRNGSSSFKSGAVKQIMSSCLGMGLYASDVWTWQWKCWSGMTWGLQCSPWGRISHGGIQSFVSRTLSVTADHVTGEAWPQELCQYHRGTVYHKNHNNEAWVMKTVCLSVAIKVERSLMTFCLLER